MTVECRAARWAANRPADCSGEGAHDAVNSTVVRTDRRPDTRARGVAVAADWAPSGGRAAGNMAAESPIAGIDGASRASAVRVGWTRTRSAPENCLSAPSRRMWWRGPATSGTSSAPARKITVLISEDFL